MAEANIAEMKSRARAAMEMAYCPYSKFKVGVCIYAEIGDPMFISGCNVENASYSLCICAERVALSKAISDGYVEFEAMAVATDSSPPGKWEPVCLPSFIAFEFRHTLSRRAIMTSLVPVLYCMIAALE